MKNIACFLGDFYHAHDDYLTFLREVLENQPDIELTDYPLADLGRILEEKPDLIIFSLENRLNPEERNVLTWLTDELDEKIEQFVAQGGAWLALHAGMSCYPENSKYIHSVLKGYFVEHFEQTIVHYEESGKERFSFLDEHYFVNVQEKETTILMRSSSNQGKSIALWRHEYFDGKVVCYTPTHTQEGFKDKANQKELLIQILWCIEKLRGAF
ncbi:Trehalose utilisation [Pilibacter termitis]|uniref:Trehalose utilisation n=1 Tax=Pilibacter termitis TaxID=263852 RepID=A0A1T4R1S0_9ENTE|nr:ThuA domain-containing protein [Pilibacter termitis]SKA09671.1 Trehalose utilisation [Pilibacter termitis]